MKAAPVSIEPASIPKDFGVEEPVVLRSQDGRGVVTLRLNRPHAFNALSEAMFAALQREFDAIAADASVRVVVLGAEGKAFCAGHDLKEMRATPSLDYYQQLFAQCSKMMLSVQHLPVPVIARVHGVATAAGSQLVAMCDLAVASSTAKFAVSGEEAKERGLINRVAEPEQLDAEVEKLVASIISKPRVAVVMGKELFYRQAELDIAAAYEAAVEIMACNMMDEAALEGVQAFIEKRSPRWSQGEPR